MSYTRLNVENIVQVANSENTMSLLEAVKSFIHKSCEDLRFDELIDKREREEGKFFGSSIKENQIPYNMQMDIDRLCLERALERFLGTGKSEDAFDVYFCFIEMFIGKYGSVRGVVEFLSEYENNGSSLIMKHRDHYSHSVYVFALGLALFETNSIYRETYADFYKLNNSREAAHHFIRSWGLTALFHDVGYPFELPFEQIASYFELEKKNRKSAPYMSYSGIERFNSISETMKRKIAALYPDRKAIFSSTDELFAFDIANKLSDDYYFTREELLEVLRSKATRPDQLNYFMDHGYFSAMIVFKKIFESMDFDITRVDIDALTAILLHNSLYKFNIAKIKNKAINKPLKMELHPLAYLLMFCDELQCWDRIAYGRNTRMELHPMDCELAFSNNRIHAQYIYDVSQKEKAIDFIEEYKKWQDSEPKHELGDRLYDSRVSLWREDKPRVKAWSDMFVPDGEITSSFVDDISSIIDVAPMGFTADYGWRKKKLTGKHSYLSNSNFIHLYYFALTLNGRWMQNDDWKKARVEGRERAFLLSRIDEFYEAFNKLSLEYKLSNINQAKNFDEYLHAIDCFYTDKAVDFEPLEKFTEEQVLVIGPLEHERWLKEHLSMGWKYKEKKNISNRELERCHVDMIPEESLVDGEITHEAAIAHYHNLSKEEQDKDIEPMNAMIELMNIFDGIRIYRLQPM